MSQTDRLHRRVSSLKTQLERTEAAYNQAVTLAKIWKDAFEELEVAAHANANVACGMAMEFGALQAENEANLDALQVWQSTYGDDVAPDEDSAGSAGSAGDVGC